MTSPEAVFHRAAGDRVHGASEVERELVDALLAAREDWTVAALAAGAERLRSGQPAMANLRHLARVLERGDLAVVESNLRRRRTVLLHLDESLAAAASPAIESARRVLTLSRSSAVAAVLVGSWRRGWRGETVVFDGSPAGGGASQASRLTEAMDRVRSQPDAAMPSWFGDGRTIVLIGADAVSPERIVNVSGTAALLELAAARSTPVLVVADSGKDLPDDEIDELLRAVPEVVEDGPGRRWRLFEAVSAGLVSRRIRE
jgi:translation initiation factor 2B subunit (eIF-2B alpha/beta/delta family)